VANAVSAPSDCPATAIRDASTIPYSGLVCDALAARSRVTTKLMSRGWFTMSLSFGPPGAFAFPSGKTGAATR
jgi:predicted methyltransferase